MNEHQRRLKKEAEAFSSGRTVVASHHRGAPMGIGATEQWG